MEGANWQRGGGKGAKPKRAKRPDDSPILVHTSEELDAKKRAFDDELKKRRDAKRKRQAAVRQSESEVTSSG